MDSTVVVMVEDNWVSVDGVIVLFKDKLKLVKGHEKLWALHWKDGKGEAQFENPPANYFFTQVHYAKYVQPYVDQWVTEKARQKAEFAAEQSKPENVEARARAKRNNLLNESDYVLMPDYPLTEEQKMHWTAYRQALRDLPEQEGWPMNIAWPEKPEI